MLWIRSPKRKNSIYLILFSFTDMFLFGSCWHQRDEEKIEGWLTRVLLLSQLNMKLTEQWGKELMKQLSNISPSDLVVVIIKPMILRLAVQRTSKFQLSDMADHKKEMHFMSLTKTCSHFWGYWTVIHFLLIYFTNSSVQQYRFNSVLII